MGNTTLAGVQSAAQHDSEKPEVSVVLPCLNEAETLGGCIRQIQETFERSGLKGEVVVGDNGSTDGSRGIAEGMGARVVSVPQKGYGSALMGGIAGALADYVVMGDADGSYDFRDVPKFVAQLRAGADLVMGNRFRGGIKPGAMPPLHKYVGNPVMTGLGKLFFKSRCGDSQCGLRAFTKQAYQRMDLRTTGMEFASEMLVKATLLKMRVDEIPTTLSPDGRNRPSHLRSWRDGWRHLRFLLMYSPRWLFLYPGITLMLAGSALPSGCCLGPAEFMGLNSTFTHCSTRWWRRWWDSRLYCLLFSPRSLPSLQDCCRRTRN